MPTRLGLNRCRWLAAVSVVLLAAMAGSSCPAQTATVPGTADPWLAGMPDGSTASSGDVAPAQSPVLVPGLTLVAGSTLTFTVTGSVNNSPGPSGLGPDGGGVTPHFSGAENGISDITAPINSLLGVFLGPDQPSLTSAPGALDFTLPASQDFASLAPDLKQVFFIGDGLTSGAAVQQFVVPTGATRLYLGTMDGYGWYNNDGSFDVKVGTVPEPTSLAVVLPMLAPLGLLLRRRR